MQRPDDTTEDIVALTEALIFRRSSARDTDPVPETLPFQPTVHGFEEQQDPSSLTPRTILKLFDIADEADTTFSIVDRQGRTKGCSVLGVWLTISNGTGVDAYSTDRWPIQTLSGAVYVYLKVERQSPAVSIEVGAWPGDGDDDTEYVPLWYIAWTGSAIDWANIVDMRSHHRVPGLV